MKPINNKSLREIFDCVISTPYFRCNPNSQTEINSLVCHDHLFMYILAMKSFLRFFQDVSITAHNDGSLSKNDKELLNKHIKGIKIIDPEYAENLVKKILRGFPTCYNFRKFRINLKQAFDFNILSNKDKLIMMDSDVLFIKKPNEIIDWMNNEDSSICYAYERKPYGPEIMGDYITCLNHPDIPFKFAKNLCCGFVCYYRNMFDLNLIEKYCNYILENSKDNIKRYYAQTIIALCVGHSNHQINILPLNYMNPDRGKFNPDPVFRHYFINSGVKDLLDEYVIDAKKVIKELNV